MSKKVWTAEHDEQLRLRVLAGETLTDAAKHMGFSRTALRRHRDELGLTSQKRGMALTDEQHAEIRRLRRLGMTKAGIQERMGIGRSAVYASLRGFNVGRAWRNPEPPVKIHIPGHILADRDHRLSLAPRDLTAAIFGDPLPGRSALDAR